MRLRRPWRPNPRRLRFLRRRAALAPETAPPATQPATSTAALGEVITLGASERTQQFGVIGRAGSAKVALDLNGCNTISLFGVQGFGKSYTMGVIAEMAVQPMPGINTLPSPLATVIFHYHKSDGYEPEFATALHPNAKVTEVERLAREYGASPEGLRDMVLLVPQAKLEQRREEYPGIEVRPIRFASSELGADGWKFLMGAVGNDSLYVKQIVAIMQRARGKLTLAKLKSEIEDADLPKGLRKLAEARIALAEDYIDDGVRLGEVLRPGRTVIVDLRDEWLERDDALGLFVVMMTIFGAVRYQGKVFNKLMVFDEAHKYITESELIGQVVGIIREMRHQATSVLIASQDPLSVPRAVIELTSHPLPPRPPLVPQPPSPPFSGAPPLPFPPGGVPPTHQPFHVEAAESDDPSAIHPARRRDQDGRGGPDGAVTGLAGAGRAVRGRGAGPRAGLAVVGAGRNSW